MSQKQQLSLLDLLNIASFIIGLQNLEENLTQGDKQDLQKDFTEKTNLLLDEIHRHLKEQDLKIDTVIALLRGEMKE